MRVAARGRSIPYDEMQFRFDKLDRSTFDLIFDVFSSRDVIETQLATLVTDE